MAGTRTLEMDRQFAELIRTAIAAGGPPIATLPVEESRATYRQRYLERGATPVELNRIQDISIDGPGGPVSCRLYDPEARRRGEALIYFHGGGFVVGDIEAYDPQCRQMASRTGCAIVSVGYRLAPEHPFPAAVEDALAVAEYLLGCAETMGLDPDAIAVGGDSAGGNLAAVVAQHFRGSDRRIRFQLLLYPSLDKTPFVDGGAHYQSIEDYSSGFFLDKSTMEWFTDHLLENPRSAWDHRASPLLADDLSGVCPAYIVTAGFDPLRDIGKAYADKLSAAGATVLYRCFDPLIHNFLGYVRVIDAAESAFQIICADTRAAMDFS